MFYWVKSSLCHNFILRVFHYSSRRARRGGSNLGYPTVCTYFPAEVIMFLFSRPIVAIKESCEWFLANYETCRKWWILEFLNCCLYTKESALVKNIILELGMYCFSPSYYNYVLVIKMSTANKDIQWLNRYLLIFFKFGNKSLSIPCISTRSKSMVYWSPLYLVFIPITMLFSILCLLLV